MKKYSILKETGRAHITLYYTGTENIHLIYLYVLHKNLCNHDTRGMGQWDGLWSLVN